MDHATHNKIVSFIWSIADDCPQFTLKKLLGNPSQLEANFNQYLDAFSSNVAEIIEKFDLRNQIRKMAVADARFDKRLAEEMQWIYQQWGEQVYEPGFLSAKEQKDALDDWLEKEEIDRKAADKKKLLDPKFWTAKLILLEAGEQLHQHLGDDLSHDFNQFQKDVKAALKKLKLKLSAPQLKAILEAVSWRDPEAEPVIAKQVVVELPEDYDFDRAPLVGDYLDGATLTRYEPDSELRDTENVPMNYMGNDLPAEASAKVGAYFQSEVLPHVDDAWIDESKTVIGYEISFNKYFYVHQPLRDLDEVVQEIRDLEAETEGLLEKILDFSK